MGLLCLTLELRGLPALKHLRLDNLAPASISVPEGCQLHKSWDDVIFYPEGQQFEAFRVDSWLAKSLWEDLPLPLSSFQLTTNAETTPAGLEALQSIFTTCTSFESVLLQPGKGGFTIEISSTDQGWNACLQPKSLSILTMDGCSLRILDGQSSWESLVLYNVDSGLLELLLPSTSALLSNLKDFCMYTQDTRGPFLVQLQLVMSRSGRACRIWSCMRGDHNAQPHKYLLTSLSGLRELHGFESPRRAAAAKPVSSACIARACCQGPSMSKHFRWSGLTGAYVSNGLRPDIIGEI